MSVRLDKALVDRGILSGRDRAVELIKTGGVTVNGNTFRKPSMPVEETDDIQLAVQDIPFVSRGGLKLAGALDSFDISLQGVICMDIGASTGGFTDCMLQNGARKVWAVDVGHGQLAQKLCLDPRVINLEGTNIRSLTKQTVTDEIDFFSVDVSFISLWHIFPVLTKLCTEKTIGVCLVKPQFEAGPGKVGKKGVVKNPAIHREVLEKVLGDALLNGFYPLGLEVSPIQGPEGNIEFLLYLSRQNRKVAIDIGKTVQKAHYSGN